jgi:outer membrane protein OmpA-like peptidoglycan-associated protein
MSRYVTAALFALGAWLGTAVAQTSPAQPVFRVTVVGRTTPAINYRPRRGETKVDLAGTALMPGAHGEVVVEGKRGYMELDVRVDELEPPGRFGSEYLTYVLWAITPEGRARNLGEIQIDDDDDTLDVTTDLQAFGLIVTAEPYFAVTQPSDVVVLENVVRDGTKGRVETIAAKYELLQRGSYLLQHDPTDLKVERLEPGASLDLAQARNAIALATLAAADRYATETFAKAVRLLAEAEEARKKRRRGNALMMPARQAVQTAEDSRLIAMERQEEAFEAEERARAAQREAAAIGLARSEEAARRQLETDRAVEAARRQAAEQDAERLRQEAARDKAEMQRQLELERSALREQAEADKLAEANARLTAEREKAEADAARAAAEAERVRITSEAERARIASEAEQARLATEAQQARAAAEVQSAQAREAAAVQAREAAEREKAALRDELREQLSVILETRETARGLVVNMSDVLFDTDSASLKPGAREKLSKIAGVLLAHQNLQVAVEGHTDSVGRDSYNQGLSERRANSVRDYLLRQGIAPAAVATSGFGEGQPLVSNDSAAGRQQNRRVEIVVSGEAIGTTAQRNQ